MYMHMSGLLARIEGGKMQLMLQEWAYACDVAFSIVPVANVTISLLFYRGTEGWTDATGCFHRPDSTPRSAD